MTWSAGRTLVVVLLVAGCLSSGGDGVSQAKTAAQASHAAAESDHDYLLFLGITGTEGPLNWTHYEHALRAASDPGSSIADAFDQDVDNGDFADGRLGSWLTTHFVFDEARRLLGGLYTQYSPEHGLRTVYAPFRGPYSGTLALPDLQALGGEHLQLPIRQDGTVLCALTSSMASWQVDSREAAALAMARPLMQQHMEAHPDAELTYYYMPRLGVEEGCDASLDVASNHWVVSHSDLDAFLAGGSPTVAEVRIDAQTGEVLSESVRPLYIRPPEAVHEAIAYQDALLPTAPTNHSVEIHVDEAAFRLDVHALRTAAPQWERSASTRLVTPEGTVHASKSFAEPLHWYRVTLPQSGTWRLDYLHEPLEPAGTHEVSVRAVVSFG